MGTSLLFIDYSTIKQTNSNLMTATNQHSYDQN